MRLKGFVAGGTALILSFLIGCILDGRQAGRGSEVENEVYGTLVDANGRPVRGARVMAISERSANDTESAVTNAAGRYAFDSLPPGGYNLLGDYGSGSLVVYIPGVAIGDSGLDLGIDTLRLPGVIRGRFLAGTRGKAGVLSVVSGLSRLELSDDSGRFQINGIPQGRYTIRYSAAGFLIPEDTGIVVQAGLPTDLPDKLLEYDPADNPPEPFGLEAVYDTLAERVILTWEAVPVSDLDGFLVYRDKPDFLNPEIVRNGFTKGTRFVDSSITDQEIGSGNDFVYRIRSRDKGLNQSQRFSAPAEVHAVPKSLVTTLAVIETDLPQGAASPGDSVRMVLKYANPTRTIREIAWFRSGDDVPLRVVLAGSGTGLDTLRRLTGGPGAETYAARLTDDAGSRWYATATYRVVPDLPIAMAGADREVSIADSVQLRGTATDVVGHITRWEWSVGGSAFFEAPGGSYEFKAPSAPSRLSCILHVTDDDGNSASDTLIIAVLEDPPTVSAGRDTTVSLGDRILLHPSAHDRFGRVVAWDWDIWGGGRSAGMAQGDTVVQAPIVPGTYASIIRVTDDDGLSASDTMTVTVLPDPPEAYAGRDTILSIKDSLQLHGEGKDKFGRIVKWEWRVESDFVWRDLGRDPVIRLPDTAMSPCRIVLRVTDDDGQTGIDVMLVQVLRDAPVAILSPRGTAEGFAGDTAVLNASGSSDRFGSIVRWEWKAGSAGAFETTAGPVLNFPLPSAPDSSYPIILKLTDDDGQSAEDTLRYRIVAKGGGNWLKVPVTMPFLTRNLPAVAVFRDKLWLIGGELSGAMAMNDVWSSDDGVHWTLALATGPFPSRKNHSAVAFGGKLWVIGGLDDAGKTLYDIWSTPDGTVWSRDSLPAAFPIGLSMRSAVMGGRIWALAGQDSPKDSVRYLWSSADGHAWTPSATAPIPARALAQLAFTRGDELVVLGRDNVLYATSDGSVWSPLALDAPVPTLYWGNAIGFDGSTYLLGSAGSMTEVWRLQASGHLERIAQDPFAGGQGRPAFIGFKGRLWSIGGFRNSGTGMPGSDVWFSE
jgi:hypothetical protein